MLAFTILISSCLFYFIQGVSSSTKDEVCASNTHVCTTLMKYKDNRTFDEGPNCPCKEGKTCSAQWAEPSMDKEWAKTLTWQHYERAHWSLQYKFCEPLFKDMPVCQKMDELAVEVQTPVDAWTPYVSMPRCRCPENAQVKIRGWERVGAVWKYEYVCEKAECVSEEPGKSPMCARIYIDPNRPDDKVMKTQFLCNCGDGLLCPARYDERKDKTLVDEETGGKYAPKFCRSIVKKSNKNNNK